MYYEDYEDCMKLRNKREASHFFYFILFYFFIFFILFYFILFFYFFEVAMLSFDILPKCDHALCSF